jgi:hypothetical protein
MQRGSRRGKGQRAAAQDRAQRHEGSIGRARGATSGTSVRLDGARHRRMRQREEAETEAGNRGDEAMEAEARAPARDQVATDDCRRRKLPPRGVKKELFFLPRA